MSIEIQNTHLTDHITCELFKAQRGSVEWSCTNGMSRDTDCHTITTSISHVRTQACPLPGEPHVKKTDENHGSREMCKMNRLYHLHLQENCSSQNKTYTRPYASSWNDEKTWYNVQAVLFYIAFVYILLIPCVWLHTTRLAYIYIIFVVLCTNIIANFWSPAMS